MSAIKKDEEREQRIIMQIVVDAYGLKNKRWSGIIWVSVQCVSDHKRSA